MTNFGYLHDQDQGEMADAGYDWPKQHVIAITGLNALTGLRLFFCSDTDDDQQQVLTGFLDLSGMANLVQVECYHARVSSVNLDGCTSLIRLDLEQKRFPTSTSSRRGAHSRTSVARCRARAR